MMYNTTWNLTPDVSGASFLEDFWRQNLGAPKLKKSSHSFKTYTNQVFHPIGDLSVKLCYNGKTIEHTFPIVKGTSLFGRDLLCKLQIDWKAVQSQCNHVASGTKLTLESLFHEYRDIFSEPTGLIKDFKATVVLKDDAIPKLMKARSVPYALLSKADKELKLMEQKGVIERIDHSDWASPLVVVANPNGGVRITGDFKHTVNAQLCINQYPIANPEEMFHSISGGEKFSKLDGPNAYHQIELDEASRECMVVNTHRGLFRY
jgi:hypothetical protein